jgi:hypothetical protein
MAFEKRRVKLSGTLSGNGQTASCTVYATKVTEPVTGVSTYAKPAISEVSEEMPDGDYKVVAAGTVFKFRHEGAEWYYLGS